MKRYVNCAKEGQQDTIHTTEQGARDYAAKWGGYYAVAVEIELPDPPHEWKVGDWFTCERWPGNAALIVAPNGPGTFWVVVFRRSDMTWLEVEVEPDYLDATPCDPPAWFTDGGAS